MALQLTLHDGHQPGADPGHHVAQQPLSHSVDLDPADDGQKRERCVLGPLGVTAAFQTKTVKVLSSSSTLDLCLSALQITLVYLRHKLPDVIQHGLPSPVDLLVVIGEAVLGVHGSAHGIVLPGSRHAHTFKGETVCFERLSVPPARPPNCWMCEPSR